MADRAPDAARRRVLKAGLGATALFLPVPYAWVWAQSEGAMRLLRLPKIALVLGNSKYASVPTLTNPGNDARAISDLLRQSGFEVTAKLDATQDDMATAIRTYVQTLAARKAVGLFYFAGHGVQLAWRNYLVPVDAAVRRSEDIPKTCIDLTGLMDGINKASNPMNVVILDACRENPFGAEARAEGRGLSQTEVPGSTPLYATARNDPVSGEVRGLSQMDAPHSTLLAYATAPGNVASDGEGANGLYTENLLREMRVPEAKIEEIFKRVRLHVRRRTNGQQIPWESTSLEEDFYFVPPQALSTLADEEAERERKQEMALREKRRTGEEAERKRKQEQALREAKLAAEEAERKRQQELALLEQQRIADEAERKRKQELALQEAQRVVEEAERKRREERALREARLAEEEAQRKYTQELALREKRRAEEEAERGRKEGEALRKAKLAEDEAERKYKQELALREKRTQDEARQREQLSATVQKPTPEQSEREFEMELAIWEKIKASTEPGPFEDYLLRYPSGRFSELAQLRLDQVLALLGEKKIQMVSASANPYSKGTATANTTFVVGDQYVYRLFDLYTKLEVRRNRLIVTETTHDRVIFNNGGMVNDYLGNLISSQKEREVSTARQFFVGDYSIGKKWKTRFIGTGFTGEKLSYEYDCRVVDREQKTVPAGTFNAFKVETLGYSNSGGRLRFIYWIAPDQVNKPIATERMHRNIKGQVYISDGEELVSYSQKR